MLNPAKVQSLTCNHLNPRSNFHDPGNRAPPDMENAMVDFLETKGNSKLNLDFRPIR